MKYGEARYEDQMYGDGPASGGGASEMNPDELKMIEPEGLTPGYEGHTPLNDNMAEQADPHYVGTEVAPEEKAIEQMNELLKKKIDATLAGDVEGAAKLEQMIAMHAERNGIAYESA